MLTLLNPPPAVVSDDELGPFVNVNVPWWFCADVVAFESASSMRIVYAPSGTTAPARSVRSHVAVRVPV